jgi:hypothetical protein
MSLNSEEIYTSIANVWNRNKPREKHSVAEEVIGFKLLQKFLRTVDVLLIVDFKSCVTL